MDPILLSAVNALELETLIRPAGFQRQKAQTLLGLARHVSRSVTSFENHLARPMTQVRGELLALRGIGPETADSILLYAGGQEIFVVDAYLRRFLVGIGCEAFSRAKYEDLRVAMEKLVCERQADLLQLLVKADSATPSHPPTTMSQSRRSPLADIYNELHAVLVRDGVEKRRPSANAPGLNKRL